MSESSSDVAAAMATPSCKEGFLGRCEDRDQICMLVCVMHGLLQIVRLWRMDFVDVDVNKSGTRLSSTVASWCGSGERLRWRVTS